MIFYSPVFFALALAGVGTMQHVKNWQNINKAILKSHRLKLLPSNPSVPTPVTHYWRKDLPYEGNELYWAIAKSDLEGVKKWSALVKNINWDMPNTVNPLTLACEAGNLEIVKYLVEVCGAAVNDHASYSSCLTWAHIHGNYNIIKYLLEKGASPNAQTWLPTKDSPAKMELYWAIATGNLEAVKKWPKPNIFININAPFENDYGNTTRCNPLQLACKLGYYDIVKVLIKQHGASVNYQNKVGKNPLTIAYNCNHAKIVQYLLKRGAKPGKNSPVSLHTAAEVGSTLYLIDSLLKAGFPINAQDKLRNTPLHYACLYGNIKGVKFLLENNARVDLKNKYGKTPLDLTKEKCCDEEQREPIIALLMKKVNQNKN